MMRGLLTAKFCEVSANALLKWRSLSAAEVVVVEEQVKILCKLIRLFLKVQKISF